MIKLLITGCAGFIGSHLTEKLLDNGFNVVGVDNFNDFYNPSIKYRNISFFENHVNFKLFKADLSDEAIMLGIFKSHKIDIVIHLAASAGVQASMKDPVHYASNNIMAHVALLNVMQKCKINKLIFASSSSVYGGITDIPFKENMILNNVKSPYAATKLSSEIFNKLYFDTYNISSYNLRFFTVYGPRQRPDLAIYKFFDAICKNQQIFIYGEGLLMRDYTYISDTVDGILKATSQLLEKDKPTYEIFNLGNNKPVKTIDLLKQIEDIIGKRATFIYKETPPGDVPITYADISKAQKALKYNPVINIKNGLESFWQWFKCVN
jgi:nucleoside-diphosphate-sugar epimerase